MQITTLPVQIAVCVDVVMATVSRWSSPDS